MRQDVGKEDEGLVEHWAAFLFAVVHHTGVNRDLRLGEIGRGHLLLIMAHIVFGEVHLVRRLVQAQLLFKKPEVPVLRVNAILVGTEVPHVLDEAGLELVLCFGDIKQGGTLHWFVVVRGIDLLPHLVVHQVTPEMVHLGLGILFSTKKVFLLEYVQI